MSYTALYRKFRPNSFEDVKGQDAIVTTLRNQIKKERIGHAYLFCGTRGTGKTTVAKILAKAVNCENPADGNPCNECPTCRAINSGASMNVIEIDAASNNGVDNIREIVEEVRYSPTEGKFKVYIIDEVHMLSAGAFNALLKTLEEPPAYVLFILATTEVHKIPITIMSRCQRYDFKRITVECISDRLTELMDKEGLSAEEKALRYIARMADGALRDALSLLDQCIAFYPEGTLTYDNVLEVLGNVDVEVFAKLLRYVRKRSVSECIELLDQIILAGRELTQFTIDFTWYLRNLVLIKVSEDMEDILEVSSDQLVLMKQEAGAVDTEQLLRYIRIFSELSNQFKYATQKRVALEIALIKLCRPETEHNNDALYDRICKVEEQLERGDFTPVKAEKPAEPEAEITPEELEKAVTEDMKQIAVRWKEIIQKVPAGTLRTMLISVIPSPGPDNQLLLVCRDSFDEGNLSTERHIKEIKETVQQVIGKQIEVRVVLQEQEDTGTKYLDLSKLKNKFKDKIAIDYE